MSPVVAPLALPFSLVTDRQPALRGYALKLTRDSDWANDLVQDTLIKAFRFWHRFQPQPDMTLDRAVSAWIHKICYTLFCSAWKRRRARREIVEAVLGDTPGEASAEPEQESGLSDELRAAMDDLPEQWRKIVEAVWLRDGKYHEVARELGIPIGTVMSSLHRVRNRLIARLGPYAAAEFGIRASTP